MFRFHLADRPYSSSYTNDLLEHILMLPAFQGAGPCPASSLRLRRTMSATQLFLLSPAFCGGKRAAMLRRAGASSPLALRLRGEDNPPTLGEVFSFISGLYFRGKLTYARTFARSPAAGGVYVITPTRGLLRAGEAVRLRDLEEFAARDIDAGDPEYRRPLEADAAILADAIGPDGRVVLLGSVASGKYIDVLGNTFGDRLLFPADFVGRGDMSRGGLLLRAARSGEELEYIPVRGAVRRGKRPPRLPQLA